MLARLNDKGKYVKDVKESQKIQARNSIKSSVASSKPNSTVIRFWKSCRTSTPIRVA